MDKDTKQHVNISGGPLAYRYQFEEIYIHYGTENVRGSEHYIQGYSFPGEVRSRVANKFIYFSYGIYLFIQIQIYGFNKELYHNMSEAQHKSQGIVGLSLMVQIGETPNPELRIITSTFNKVLYRGGCVFLLFSICPHPDSKDDRLHFRLRKMLPEMLQC